MLQKQQGFGVTAVVLIVAVIGLVAGAGYIVFRAQNKTRATATLSEAGNTPRQASSQKWKYGQADPNQPPASKSQVIAAADAYIVERVGSDNFSKHFMRLPARDAFANPTDSAFDFIAYYYKPTARYDTEVVEPSEYASFVQVNRNRLGEIYADFVPDCKKNANQCNFAVDLQKATAIGLKNGLNEVTYVNIAPVPSEVDGSNGASFGLGVISCPQKKAVYINYATGKVLGTVTDSPCLTLKDDLMPNGGP